MFCKGLTNRQDRHEVLETENKQKNVKFKLSSSPKLFDDSKSSKISFTTFLTYFVTLQDDDQESRYTQETEVFSMSVNVVLVVSSQVAICLFFSRK